MEDHIGLVVLDEPAAKQSDPTILDMHMRAVTKDSNASTKDAVVVKKLDRADKNHREIDQWIANINELHKAKPATNVHYTKPMADIEQLMQVGSNQIVRIKSLFSGMANRYRKSIKETSITDSRIGCVFGAVCRHLSQSCRHTCA